MLFFININMPYTIAVFPTMFIFLMSFCVMYGLLSTPKVLKITYDKLADCITFEYKMIMERFDITMKRKMSDLKDIRKHAVRQKSKNGPMRTIGYQLYMIFKDSSDQHAFLVRGDDGEIDIYMNEISVFALNGQARMDSNYEEFGACWAISQTKNLFALAFCLTFTWFLLTFVGI